MPFVYDHIVTSYKRHATQISFSFNDQEAKVDDYFISVVCEDVEAFVRNQINQLTHLSLNTLETDGDQMMLETNINRICRCLKNSLQSRTEKLKVEHFNLSVLEISQVVSAVNLLHRDILRSVIVHLPFEDQVFPADDFIPLIEGQGRQRLDLTIMLHKFSLEVLEEVRTLLTYTSQLNSITVNYTIIDEKCIELIAETEHSPEKKTVKFSIDHADDPIEEMTMLNLSDNKCHLNIFEIPSIMKSIASNLECPQIQSLRKVSRGIRQSVDYVKPDPHIHRYVFWLKNYLRVDIEQMMNGPIATRYKGSLEQKAVRVVNDFDLNTRHQKSCMNWLSIEMDEETWKLKEEEDDPALSKFFKLLRDVLISRTSPLKVEYLTLYTRWQCLMMDILPYLDAEFLENIHIHRIEGINEECTIDLDEISKTEQWSKAKRLWMTDLTVRMSIQDMNILNFKWIQITVETMTREDITYCRKSLPQSSVFLVVKIRIKKCSSEDFLATLGEPYRVVNDIKYIWYFRIENEPKYLHVMLEQIPLQNEGRLQFAKVPQTESPFFRIS
ncbi:hypothetical protein GCK72_021286 [Caenorhabditis remanei]|uniref:DUF38 domain-containing protein n=1 Tax=Caenorhabditis remanei TaxID=31234 RepID=A0A6A5GJP6_CAERE|nr:hypothetical protein GCK72_021286 [Caenorhabditis remanei]KAF1754722.1 hypothetical protein GCK72_021286 [Caenorhabditis remanei]